MTRRRRALVAVSLLLTAFLVATAVAIAAYPEKAIEMIIIFEAGGAADISGRVLAQAAEKPLKVPIAPINKPGAGGAVGVAAIAAARPDGYTIGWITGSLLTATNMGNVPFDYQALDYVALVNLEPTAIVVRVDAPWTSLREFVEDAKAKPGKIRVGNAGSGSFTHISAAALAHKAKIDVRHVPLGGRRMPSLLGGEVEAVSIHPPETMSNLKAGKVRVLGISFPDPVPALKGVPTWKEFGWDVGFYQFRGVAAPKGMPGEAVKSLESAFQEAAKTESYRTLANDTAITIGFRDGAGFRAFVQEQDGLIKAVIRELGIGKKK
jgi:tripartite-type tricarboxylate transporter receptor subunit TctC